MEILFRNCNLANQLVEPYSKDINCIPADMLLLLGCSSISVLKQIMMLTWRSMLNMLAIFNLLQEKKLLLLLVIIVLFGIHQKLRIRLLGIIWEILNIIKVIVDGATREVIVEETVVGETKEVEMMDGEINKRKMTVGATKEEVMMVGEIKEGEEEIKAIMDGVIKVVMMDGEASLRKMMDGEIKEEATMAGEIKIKVGGSSSSKEVIKDGEIKAVVMDGEDNNSRREMMDGEARILNRAKDGETRGITDGANNRGNSRANKEEMMAGETKAVIMVGDNNLSSHSNRKRMMAGEMVGDLS